MGGSLQVKWWHTKRRRLLLSLCSWDILLGLGCSDETSCLVMFVLR